MADDEEIIDSIRTITIEASGVRVRNAAKREIDMRIMPWNTTIETVDGLEEFARGAFDGIDPTKVFLYPPEHEMRIGIGQDGKPVPVRRPSGKGVSSEARDDGQYMTFRVARTADGDDQLALADDGIVTGVSPEFVMVHGGSEVSKVGRRRKIVHRRVDLRGVTTTYRPAYGEQAAVLAVRSQMEDTMPEDQTAAPVVDYGSRFEGIESALTEVRTAMQARQELPADAIAALMSLPDRLDAMEEKARASFEIPNVGAKHGDKVFGKGEWASLVFRMLSGEKVSQREIETRVAADLITTDNLGVVPEQFLSEIIGIIDPARPFMNTTRRLNLPAAGLQLTVPVISTRPTVGVQAEEKDELTSTPTSITDTSFSPITVGGYGDISLQLLRRADPSYLSLYLELLAEAYAVMADDKAVDALLAAGGLQNGGTVVPDDGPQFGQAWENAAAVSRLLTPDTIWMSSAAIGAFIDAKSDTTNAPLYANLQGNFTAGGGAGGTISGLRPVHVPALNDEAVDIIVGPSRAFGWTEDGAFTLQVDVPAKAGRDVALVGMLWYAPLYPAAFTKYAIGS